MLARFPDKMRSAHITEQPIETAPREVNRPLLLYCPEQGGSQIGVWSGSGSLDNLLSYVELSPSHWLPLPPDPPGADV